MDLKFAALFLLAARAENWIAAEELFDATQQIWSAFFFTSEHASDTGWIEYRHRSADDRDRFKHWMASESLAGALLAWTVAARGDSANDPKKVRYRLAGVALAARLPWIWESGDADAICAEAMEMLQRSHAAQTLDQGDDIGVAWLQLRSHGRALRALENAVRDEHPGTLKSRVSQRHVRKGSVLWQGRKGFGIAAETADRSMPKATSDVLKLRANMEKTAFQNQMLIPLRALLLEEVLAVTSAFDVAARAELGAMLDEIEQA